MNCNSVEAFFILHHPAHLLRAAAGSERSLLWITGLTTTLWKHPVLKALVTNGRQEGVVRLEHLHPAMLMGGLICEAEKCHRQLRVCCKAGVTARRSPVPWQL